MLLPKTVPDGEAVILWKPNGTRKIIEGPQRIFDPLARIERLVRVSATEGEYLVIRFRDGHTEHRPGPCTSWLDPLEHIAITPAPATTLDAHQAIVIYDERDGEIAQRVVRGPAVYIPTPTENLHQFRWHGDDGKGGKVPRKLCFEKLRVIPDQMYFNVTGVRTADEALVTAKLMVFFELVDIERMLKETHDPIADFINALTADVIRFAGSCNFEEFKTRAAELNALTTYEALLQGAARIGYRINKVVYRGYAASGKLQTMHDNAIEMRTSLVLEMETEQQQQELQDLKQQREHERAAEQRQELERTLTHTLEQARKENQEKLAATLAQEEQDLAIIRQKQENEKTHQEALLTLQQQERDHLKALGADITQILVAQEHNPDKTIRFENQATQVPIHLHEAV